MIKQIIASTLLATSIGIQNATYNDITNQNSYRATTNIQSKIEYNNQDQELEKQEQLKIVEYNNSLFGANANAQARSIVYGINDTIYDTYEYNQIILIKVNNPTNLTITRLLYEIDELNIPNPTKTDTHDGQNLFTLNYLPTLSQTEQNFISNQNYNTYDELNTIYQEIKTDMVYLMDFQKPAQTWLAQGQPLYIAIEINISYIANSIAYNGTFIFGMNVIKNIRETLTYEQPAITNYEVVDIPGLMFTVLGMPFAWISTAFNFTIFEGTPYAINISAILMAIVIGLIAIYIAKKIIK